MNGVESRLGRQSAVETIICEKNEPATETGSWEAVDSGREEFSVSSAGA